MRSTVAATSFSERAVTMVEVMVAALLIFLALGNIFAMNARSLETLRATRQATASSEMLQQRVEKIRSLPWPQVSSGKALAILMGSPAESEKELLDADPTEVITVSVPPTPGTTAPADLTTFSVQRSRGAATVKLDGDLGTEPMLMLDMVLTWRSKQGVRQRALRTIICRTGLTRSGIFGSAFGRPVSATPAPAAP